MIPGLALLEKIFILAIDWFVADRAKKSEYKKKFDELFKRSGQEAQKSADLWQEEKKMKGKESWQKETKH